MAYDRVVCNSFENEIDWREEGYRIKMLTSNEELAKSFRLRHEIFAEELRWVEHKSDGMEIDTYDNQTVPFGVFDPYENLCSYMRLILTDQTFMMERDFGFLVSEEHAIRKSSDTAEISRLCVAPFARNTVVSGNFGIHSTSLLLLKGIFQWCRISGIRFLYAVTEEKVWRLYRVKGFPFKPIGEAYTMPDGIKAVALLMDWEEFIAQNKSKRPQLVEWFNQAPQGPHPSLLPQHEYCLPHRASVAV
jgi:acyl homoserine lactone synthase